jgi:hypothetical protein
MPRVELACDDSYRSHYYSINALTEAVRVCTPTRTLVYGERHGRLGSASDAPAVKGLEFREMRGGFKVKVPSVGTVLLLSVR